MPNSRTHYDSLQVSPHASESVIRAAFRALSQQHHPDKHPDQSYAAGEAMKDINNAYETLSDPARRAEYDASLEQQRRQSAPRPPPRGTPEGDANTQQRAAASSSTALRPAPAAPVSGRVKHVHWSKGPSPQSKQPSRWMTLGVVLAGFAGAGSTIISGNSSTSYTWLAQLQSGQFWGQSAVYLLICCACAGFGWVLASAIPALRTHRAMAAGVAVVVGLAVLGAGSLLADRVPSAGAGHRTSLTSPSPIALPEGADSSRYAAEVAKLEARFPRMNPDSPAFSPQLIGPLRTRYQQLVDSGVEPHDAVRRAAEEILAE